MKIEIQKLLFPQVGRCTEEELYFRVVPGRIDEKEKLRDNNGKLKVEEKNPDFNDLMTQLRAIRQIENGNADRVYADLEQDRICFDKKGKVWFDTYFNSFSAGKWTKYTIVDNLSLRLELKGAFRITLYTTELFRNKASKIKVLIKSVISDHKETFSFDYPSIPKRGLCAFSLEALEDGAEYYGGAFESEIPEEKIQNVKIGICICTFKREDFITRNLGILNKSILENPESQMYGHLEVLISDNGKTLDIPKLSTDKIHIYPNRNLGGAGGFTRDLIEVHEHNDTYQLTHVLLMDDDEVIEPEALVRTWRILSLVRDEYKDTFIGGAMLRRDRPYSQVESGAQWNAGRLVSLKAGLDMRELRSVLKNEIEEYAEYNAWWYCCMPVSVIREDNLPMPIFIRGDDLEYGLRNMKHLILMNGICLWHEPFEYKYASNMEYYIMRNLLIDNCFHFPGYGVGEAIGEINSHCIHEIYLYRYKNVDMYLRGIDDFLKGPKCITEQDGEAVHKELMAMGYKFQPLDKLPVAFTEDALEESYALGNKKGLKFKILRKLTDNGIKRMNLGDAVVPVTVANSKMTYRKSRILYYDLATEKGFVTKYDKAEAERCKRELKAMLQRVEKELPKAQELWRTEGLKLRTLEFWKEYLGI